MEEGIAWILLFIALCVAFRFLYGWVLGGLYWLFSALGYFVFGTLDGLFSAPLAPHAPWVMWGVWGAIIGATLAFWTLAPVYGLRKQRAWIAAAPFILMLVVALVRLVV